MPDSTNEQTFSIPLTFHVMDYQEWNNSFRKAAIQGETSYIEWFLRNSKVNSISNKLYHEVIIRHPVISTALTNAIIDRGIHKTSEMRNLVYFTFSADAILSVLKSKIHDRYNTPELENFKSFLKEIAAHKLYVLGEFDTRNGWFNYDELKEFRNRME